MSIFFPNIAIPTGAVAVYLNGKPFGWCTGFKANIDTPKEEIRGIDCILPVELAPTTASISCQMNVVRPRNSGGLEGMGIVAPVEYLTNEKYFSVALLDKAIGNVVFMSNKCSIVNQSWDLPVKSIVTGSFSFKCLDYKNEFNAPTGFATLGF